MGKLCSSCLHEIHSLYTSRLKELGIQKQVNKTRLKEKLLEHFVEAQAEQFDGRNIALIFRQGMRNMLKDALKRRDFTEDAVILAKAHCAINVVYDSVYFCVYFAYTINIPRVVYIMNIHLVYFKNPQVTIFHCAYSRSIKNTQTTMT